MVKVTFTLLYSALIAGIEKRSLADGFTGKIYLLKNSQTQQRVSARAFQKHF